MDCWKTVAGTEFQCPQEGTRSNPPIEGLPPGTLCDTGGHPWRLPQYVMANLCQPRTSQKGILKVYNLVVTYYG